MMAELLSVRTLEPSSVFLGDGNSSNSDLEKGLVQPEREAHNSFQNPVFQEDELSSVEQQFPERVLEVKEPKRSLTPSDSGIHIPYDGISKSSFDNDPYKCPPEVNGIAAKSLSPDKDTTTGSHDPEESLIAICVQVLIPFLIAGVGTCGAGLVLDYAEKWKVFIEVKELFILVPTLLGLKGNLEMTLASRVSTQANIGQLNTFSEQWSMCWGNMALVQCQATLLSLASACFASAISSADKGFDLEKALLLGASALFTAAVASLVLGAITLAVVLASHRFHINPDNVATPIAASLGDVTTMGILACIASYLHNMGGSILSSSLCMGILIALVPLWMFLSYRNPYVKKVLFTGWTPVILAVAITTAGGYILEFSIGQFEGFAVFQPVINGVAGNLVAVQASRISTYFHKCCEPGSRPPDGSNICVSPITCFFGRTPHATTAKILLCMVVPGHVLFGYAISLIKGGKTALTVTFLPFYVGTAFLQVMILLYLAQCLINFLWRRQMDPDNWAIPLLTALGDLSGMIALTSAFLLHSAATET